MNFSTFPNFLVIYLQFWEDQCKKTQISTHPSAQDQNDFNGFGCLILSFEVINYYASFELGPSYELYAGFYNVPWSIKFYKPHCITIHNQRIKIICCQFHDIRVGTIKCSAQSHHTRTQYT